MNNQYFSIATDAYSEWSKIFQISQASQNTTIEALESRFAHFGIPEIIVRRKDVHLSSVEFTRFCSSLSGNRFFSLMYHSQSIGQDERFMDTLKRTLQKLQGEWSLILILNTSQPTYCSTPDSSATNTKTPSELIFWKTDANTTWHNAASYPDRSEEKK